jgi:polysaccharide biosynthesis transport protein
VIEVFTNRPGTLADYLAVIRRRKWIVIGLPVVAAVTAFVIAQGQSPRYRATAQVLVDRSNVASSITSIDPTAVYDRTSYLATVAEIARSPALAARVASASHLNGVSAGQLLGHLGVSADPNADVLYVSVSSPDPAPAVQLANTYATQFGEYKAELDTRKIDAALSTLGTRTKALLAKGGANSPAVITLQQEQTQLETVRTLLANNITVLQPATSASKVSPRPKHTALLGLLLGGILGLALAFGVEAIDRRTRSEKEIEALLGVPLLARLPRPARHLRDRSRLAMIFEPALPDAELFRKLKTSLDFLSLDRPIRTIMITSAVPREGKSTTAANLAVAFARSGRRVALVDLDLRQPLIHSFFYPEVGYGVSDVVAGDRNLAGALRPYFLPVGKTPSEGVSATNGRSGRSARPAPAAARAGGRESILNARSPRSSTAVAPAGGKESILNVLTAGTMAPMGGDALADLLESGRLGGVLDELGEQYEVILADTPPLLAVGDALALTTKVDAIVLVLHSGIERPLVEELGRQLRNSQAPVLGFVLTGVSATDAYGYGYGYGYGSYGAQTKPKAQPAKHG